MLLWVIMPITIYAQKSYYDLESIVDKINTENRYVVTSKTLKVRVSGQYHKTKAGKSFYILKKGDIVKVWSARKGKFSDTKSIWYEIFLFDEKGSPVYIRNGKPWHPNKVWGIVDGKGLKELKKSFFIVNKNCSINLTGREPYELYIGDTIVAENVPNRAIIPIEPIKKGYRVNNLYGKRTGGGSRFEGILDNKFLTPLETDLEYDISNYKILRYHSVLEIKMFIKRYLRIFFYTLFALNIIALFIISKNKPIYKLFGRKLSINGKGFSLETKLKKIRMWTDTYKHDVWVPGRVEKIGNIERHYQGHYEQQISSTTYVHFDNKALPKRYRASGIFDNTRAIQISTQNIPNIAFYYPDLQILRSPYRDFWALVFRSVGLKFRVLPIIVVSILSLLALILFLSPEFYFNISPIAYSKNASKVFEYSPLYINFDWLDEMYMNQFLKFIITTIIVYLFILLFKQANAIRKMHKNVKQDLIQLAENDI